MNKNKVKGAVDEVAGRTERQVGEWTGDTDAQVKGAGKEIKGKIEKAVGHLQDAARDSSNRTSHEHAPAKRP